MANLRDLRKELAVLREQKASKDEIKKIEDQISVQEKRNAELAEKRAEAEKARAKFKQDILKADTKSRGIEKDILKLLDSQKGKLLERFGVINKENQLKLKNIKTQVLEELRSNNDLTKADKDRKLNAVKALNATGDLQKEILADFEAGTLESMSEGEILAKILEKAGLSQKEFNASTEAAQEKILEQVEKLSKSTATLSEKGFKEMFEYVTGIEDGFDPIIKKAKMFGDLMGNATLRTAALKAGLAAVAFSLAKDIFNSAKEVRQELGLGVGEAAALGAKITVASKYLKLMGGDSQQAATFVTSIAKEFGNVEEVSANTMRNFAEISAFTGLGGLEAAKLAKSIQTIQGGSLETSLNMIEVFEATARTAGVMPKLVLEDIANSTEAFAKFAKDGGRNIAEAAAQAAKLGLNLDTVAGIAESLLEFESSIDKQMEAQVILGRSLNLDKARQLSLTGDLDGLQKEILNQVGSQAEFEAMLPIQRKALADAIGIGTADLAKFVAGEKTSAQLAKEQAEAQRESILNQETLMKGMLTMQGITAAMLLLEQARSMNASLQAAKSGAEVASKATIFGLSLGTAVATFAASVIGLAAIGGLLTAAYGAVTKGKAMKDGTIDSEGNTVLTPKGSINLDKDDDIIAGTNLLSGGGESQPNVNVDLSNMESKMDSQIKESKEMNQNTKKLLEQNQFLMTKLIRTTGGLKGDA